MLADHPDFGKRFFDMVFLGLMAVLVLPVVAVFGPPMVVFYLLGRVFAALFPGTARELLDRDE